jgi:GNAT superfamily N-acetyltransferase
VGVAGGLTFRRATVADATAVAEVWLRARRAAAPAIPPTVHDDDDVRRWVATVLIPTGATWVFVDEGQIVAMMSMGDGWIEQLYVDPAYQRNGVGSALVDFAKLRWPGGLDLWAFQSNSGARRFYERHGFVAVETTHGDNEEGAPDVRYHWPNDQATAPPPSPSP